MTNFSLHLLFFVVVGINYHCGHSFFAVSGGTVVYSWCGDYDNKGILKIRQKKSENEKILKM
jgi:hypothetical protein